MSDIANLLWEVAELKKELAATKTELATSRQEVAELKDTVQQFISDKLGGILDRIMKAVELSVDIQASNTASFYKTTPNKS